MRLSALSATTGCLCSLKMYDVSVHAGEITPKVTFVVSALLNFTLHQETPKYAMFCDQFVANVN